MTHSTPNDGRFNARCATTPPRGKASGFIDYIDHPERGLKPGQKVILVCRVSHCTQQRAANIQDQEDNLRREVEQRGAVVIDVASRIGSGKNPEWLSDPSDYAREHNAILLAESTDRFVRHMDYHSKRCPDAQAHNTELYRLKVATGGVQLMTLLHPDAPTAEVRSFQRKRGQSEKGHNGGRPPKEDSEPGFRKRRKLKWLPDIRDHNRRGARRRGIAKRVARWSGASIKTVYLWRTLATSRKAARLVKGCQTPKNRTLPPSCRSLPRSNYGQLGGLLKLLKSFQ